MNWGGIISGAIVLIAFPHLWPIGALFVFVGLIAQPDRRGDT